MLVVVGWGGEGGGLDKNFGGSGYVFRGARERERGELLKEEEVEGAGGGGFPFFLAGGVGNSKDRLPFPLPFPPLAFVLWPL